MKHYNKSFIEDFWDESDYFTDDRVITDVIIRNVEERLGYKLPGSYIELIKTKNGGTPINTCFPTKEPTCWAEDHIEISGICGVTGSWGLLDALDMKEDWEYPNIGIIICQSPSAGHDAIMLDYRNIETEDEPKVVHVEVEDKPKITYLCDTFEEFIKGLVSEETFK